MSDSEIIKGQHGTEFDRYLTRITPFGFSGALLVAKCGEIILNKGYGRAIREKNVLNTAETVFSIGSITKQFTATAILKLEMQGRLNTNDSISRYVDNIPADKEGITIHHLLTHTAGVINYTGDDYEVVYRDETIQKILDSPLLFSPGERFEYSNAGYSLLAAIVEIVSGKPYEEYVNKYLFKPAGMFFTGYRIPKWDERVVANWYLGETNNGTPLEKPYPYWNLIGNGGILSTTKDMYRWYLALKNDLILSAEAKKKLFTPFLKNYAYGWDVSKTEHGTLIQHEGGSSLGNSAHFKWFVDSDLVTVLLCNQSYGEAPLNRQVADKIEKIAFGQGVAVPPKTLETTPTALRSFEGTYELPTRGCLILSTENNALKFTAKGQDAVNSLFSTEGKPFQFTNLNQRAERLLKATVEGDYRYFKGELEDEARMKRWREIIADSLDIAKIDGSVIGIEIIGTFVFPRKEDVKETIIQLRNKKKIIAVGLLWLPDGKIWGMTTEPDRPFMLFMPVSEYMFTGYHLGLAKTIRVRFNVNNSGFTAGLTIYGKKGNVIARRVENSKEDHEARNVS